MRPIWSPRAVGIAASGDRCVLLHQVRQGDVLRRTRRRGHRQERCGRADWGLTGLIVSPLGYLLTPVLTDLADKAAASLFAFGLIRVAEQTGSTNADLLNAARCGGARAEGRWLVAAARPRDAGGRGANGSTERAISWARPLCAGGGWPAADASAGASSQLFRYFRRCAVIPDSPARLALKWPNDVLLNGGKLSGICSSGAGTRWWWASGSTLPVRRTSRDARPLLLPCCCRPGCGDFSQVLAEQFARESRAGARMGLGSRWNAFRRWLHHAQASRALPLTVACPTATPIDGLSTG
jgi:BirA family biotin operon repressor/biotin-[acetyl-CoA-carboxylase] ligase